MVVQRILLAFLALAYGLGLQVGYTSFISPILSFQGEIDLNPGADAWFIGQSLAILPALFLPLNRQSVSALGVTLIYIVVYVPCATVALHIADFSANGYIVFLVWLALCLAVMSVIVRQDADPSNESENNRPRSERNTRHLILFSWGLLGLAAALELYIISVFGLNLVLLADFFDLLYSVREGVYDRIYTERLGGTLYVVFAQRDVILPLLFALGIYRRNWWIVLASILGQTGVGLATAQKGAFGLVAFQVAIYLAWSGVVLPRVSPAVRLVGAYAAGVWLVLALHVTTGDVNLLYLTVRRALATNGVLTAYYYDYFSRADFVYYAQTLASLSGQQVWQTSYTYIIGSYMSPFANSANVNFWGDAYANLGYLGTLLVSVIFAVILLLVNSFGKRGYPEFVAIAFVPCILNVCSTGLQTSMVTGGMWLMILLLGLLPRRDERRPAAAEPAGGPLPAT